MSAANYCVTLLVRQVAQLAQLLAAVGWGYSQIGGNNLAAHPNALKSQMIGGLHAVAYLRGDCDRMLIIIQLFAESALLSACPARVDSCLGLCSAIDRYQHCGHPSQASLWLKSNTGQHIG